MSDPKSINELLKDLVDLAEEVKYNQSISMARTLVDISLKIVAKIEESTLPTNQVYHEELTGWLCANCNHDVKVHALICRVIGCKCPQKPY